MSGAPALGAVVPRSRAVLKPPAVPNGADVDTYQLSTKCANGNKADFSLVVSNMPVANDPSDLSTLDADYDYTVNIVRGRR